MLNFEFVNIDVTGPLWAHFWLQIRKQIKNKQTNKQTKTKHTFNFSEFQHFKHGSLQKNEIVNSDMLNVVFVYEIYNFKISKFSEFKFATSQITRHGFHFEVPKKRKVATKTNSYKRYGGILFQKVSLGYLLHFVQNGSSKNALEKWFLRNNCKKHKIGEKTPIYSPPNSRSTAL